MQDIKVSVIMAVYNAEPYLKQALDSIVNQSLREIEIICVDDGSTDASLCILQEYAERDSRIRVLRNTIQSDGAGAARNLGLASAVGEYISVLDADDFFELDMLELAYKKAKECMADVVAYDAYVYESLMGIDTETNYVLSVMDIKDGEAFSPKEKADNLFQLTLGAAWNCIFSREMINLNDIRFECIHHADDLGFAYVSFACAERMVVICKRLVHYRKQNESSQSANLNKWPESCCQALSRFKQELEKRGLYKIYEVSFANKAIQYIRFYLTSMTSFESFKKLYDAVKEKYLDELELAEVPDDSFKYSSDAVVRNIIKELPAEEYILQWYQNNKELLGTDNSLSVLLPSIDGKAPKLALYGAGFHGKAAFTTFLRNGYYKVVNWVDRNYARLGYPINAPESLLETDSDYVLITIENPHVYQSVREYLVNMGIDCGRIKWWFDPIRRS